jgi:hypothetical protein
MTGYSVLIMNHTNEEIDQISSKLLSYLKEELKDSRIGYSSGFKVHMGSNDSFYREHSCLAPSHGSKRFGGLHKENFRDPG